MNHADKKQQPCRGCCLIKVIIKNHSHSSLQCYLFTKIE